MSDTIKREIADRLIKELADRGMIVEGGWRAYALLGGLEKASAIQIKETRQAFFAGAQHLWASIFGFLEGGTMETEKDLARMDLLHKELEQWRKEMEQQNETKKAKQN